MLFAVDGIEQGLTGELNVLPLGFADLLLSANGQQCRARGLIVLSIEAHIPHEILEIFRFLRWRPATMSTTPLRSERHSEPDVMTLIR